MLTAPAETIRLKNGRTILADRVRQTATQVEYDVGDNSYAIPSALVDHVESGGAPLVSHASTAQSAENSASAAAQVSNFNPASLQNEDNVITRVVRNHQVDRTALNEIEQGGKRSANSGRVTEVFVMRKGGWVNPGWHMDAGGQ